MASADLSLDGRRILVCVSASIAAYKSVYIVRELTSRGAFVSVALTPSAQRFVGSETFSALASEPAYDNLWDIRGSIAHTTLGQNADLVLVVPATATTLAKMSAGIGDEIVSASLLCVDAQTPVVVAPAMHTEMWENASTQANVATLQSRGVHFVGPVQGELAGGDIGFGRLAQSEAIISRVEELMKSGGLIPQNAQVGLIPFGGSDPQKNNRPRILVTAGGTREPIDPVRVITNRSSGKMGHALAQAALASGYHVTLVTTSSLESEVGIVRIDVETAEEMHSAVMDHLEDSDVVIMSAAVADVTPLNPSKSKLKRLQGIESLDLTPTKDIVKDVVARKTDQFVVCFAAESDALMTNARSKFIDKGVDMLVANDISRIDSGFSSDDNHVYLFTDADLEPRELPKAPKVVVAYEILEALETKRAQRV